LSKVTDGALKGVCGIRGYHVLRQEKFSDDRIGRLGTFELMNHVWGQLPTAESLYTFELRRARKF
jgi:hypothetical protein